MDDIDNDFDIDEIVENSENKLCEWNNDDIHRDYCLKLKHNNLYCEEHIVEDIDNYFGLKYIKYLLYIEEELNKYIYIEYVSDIINIENRLLNNIRKFTWDWSLCFSKPEREYLYEKYILYNIDLDIYNYYNNKYKDYNLNELIRENMKIGGIELCEEDTCFNFKEINEDLCLQCIQAQQSDDEFIEIVELEYDNKKNINNYLGPPNYYKGMLKFKHKGVKYNY
jgi:hypothetical protein